MNIDKTIKFTYILLIFVIFAFFCGCSGYDDGDIKRTKQTIKYSIIEIEGCEYIQRGHGLAHKGNCKYCIEREKQMMIHIINTLEENKKQ